MKLSKAQQKVIDDAKKDIDFARTHSLREWAAKRCRRSETDRIITNYSLYGYRTREEALKAMNEEIDKFINKYSESYENNKNGIVFTYCNSRTLAKLQKLGLIEILYDSEGEHFGIDTIKILNY